ncbi:MAG TPA: glycine-rich protein [Candidatus Cybelea sp.]|nr:glycine-rich protein [Candidatus Cybelea sp.]
MDRFNRSRAAASGFVAGFLVACSGGPPSSAQSFYRPLADNVQYKKFSYTGEEQSFTVPMGVTAITVKAEGASGGGRNGGRGGRVTATIPVTPYENLAIFVGGKGDQAGGFNGGGDGGTSSYEYGYGGGGASDVRQGGNRPADRVVVAGAGGGVGGFAVYGYDEKGGAGGGSIGGAGACLGLFNGGSGSGGSQTAGGSGGAGGIGDPDGQPGANGKRFRGGPGASVPSRHLDTGGGGGGGGYYGGGGGGSGGRGTSGDGCGGGGGGGSSYAEPSAHNVKSRQGINSGNGRIVIYY